MKLILKIIVTNCILFFLLCEFSVRLLWPNPYVPFKKSVYFHAPDQSLQFHNISGIYLNAPHIVYFKTDSHGAIIKKELNTGSLLSGEKIYDLALGGSTTECALVQEGQRWPDLLDTSTLNFGRSSLHSLHTIANMHYLLDDLKLKPRYVYVMDGINNLSHFLGSGQKGFKKINSGILDNPYKFLLRNVYSLAFVWRLIKTHDYLKFYQLEVAKNNLLPLIEQGALENYWNKNKTVLKNTLKELLKKMQTIANSANTELVILTQPHAYFSQFKPFQHDLRVFPVISSKRLSLEQSHWIMQEFNSLTLAASRELGLKNIDVAGCMEKHDPTDLFYDSVHFTDAGSKQLAKCLNESMRD